MITLRRMANNARLATKRCCGIEPLTGPRTHEGLLDDFFGKSLITERTIRKPVELAGMGVHRSAHT